MKVLGQQEGKNISFLLIFVKKVGENSISMALWIALKVLEEILLFQLCPSCTSWLCLSVKPSPKSNPIFHINLNAKHRLSLMHGPQAKCLAAKFSTPYIFFPEPLFQPHSSCNSGLSLSLNPNPKLTLNQRYPKESPYRVTQSNSWTFLIIKQTFSDFKTVLLGLGVYFSTFAILDQQLYRSSGKTFIYYCIA